MLIYGGYTSSAFYLNGGVLSLADNAEIEIRNESDANLSTIFSAPTGGALTNPFNADANGRFEFFAAGREDGFRVKVTKGAQTYTLRYQRVSNLYVDMTSYTATLLLAADAPTFRSILDLKVLELTPAFADLATGVNMNNAFFGTFGVVLTASTTMGQWTNVRVPSYGFFDLTQDGTGSRLITSWHSSFKHVLNIVPVLTTLASRRDRLYWSCRVAGVIDITHGKEMTA
jgi:hypothetical protein